MISRERASHSSARLPHAVIPWPPRTTPIASGCSAATAEMSRASWKPGLRHGTHNTRSPKQARCAPRRRQLWQRRCLRPDGGGLRVPPRRVRAWQCRSRVPRLPFHIGSSRTRPPSRPRALLPDRCCEERAQAVQPEDPEPRFGKGAEVPAGALHPQQLHLRTRHRVRGKRLAGGVPSRVVGVPRVSAEPVGTLE